MPGEVIDMSDAIERAAAKRRKQNATASRRTRDRKAGKHVLRKPPGPKPRARPVAVADRKLVATSATLVATVPVLPAPVPAAHVTAPTVVGALCRVVVSGAVLYACVRLALGSYALLIGAMASLHVSGSDGAVALLVAEAVAGYWLEKRRKEPWAAWKVVIAGLLVACIAVEVDLAVVREHSAVQDRAEQAVESVHRQAAQDLEAQAHAAPATTVPAIQVERLGPQGAAALTRGQTDAMKEQAAIANERDATVEKRAH
jgi:hypothetical protein